MDQCYLLSYGEIALKGRNRKIFIKRLNRNIKRLLSGKGNFKILVTYGRVFLETDIAEEIVNKTLSKVFGLSGFTKVIKTELSFDKIKEKTIEIASEFIKNNPETKTFKINTRRSNKEFPKRSDMINRELGGVVLDNYPDLKVQMKGQDLTINIEVREKGVYLYTEMQKGPGGLPVGSSGSGVLMLSAGIDSPVAGWMMLKRGLNLIPVHFYSPPYTSVRSREKVVDQAKLLMEWGGANKLLLVPFTKVQEKIASTSKKDLTTLLVRRAMIILTCKLLEKFEAKCLITGENLGQVASQTVESMTATSIDLKSPVFRPLIGFDKQEIMNMAKKLGSYETSILPYDDCCTLFLPDNPSTKPTKTAVIREITKLELEELIEEAFNNTEEIDLRN